LKKILEGDKAAEEEDKSSAVSMLEG